MIKNKVTILINSLTILFIILAFSGRNGFLWDLYEYGYGYGYYDSITSSFTIVNPDVSVSASSSGGSSSSSSGGGGGGATTVTKDNCPTGDYSPSYYDKTCGTKPTTSTGTTSTGTTSTGTTVEKCLTYTGTINTNTVLSGSYFSGTTLSGSEFKSNSLSGITYTGSISICKEIITPIIPSSSSSGGGSSKPTTPTNPTPTSSSSSSSGGSSIVTIKSSTGTVITYTDPETKKTCEKIETSIQRTCSFPTKQISFKDVDDSFAKKYISNLGTATIVSGYYDTGLFKPNNSISRAEYLKVVLRAFCIDYTNQDTSNLTFKDVDKTIWEARVVAKALELKLINANEENFRPNDPISRAEAVKIALKMYGITPDGTLNSQFSDVDASGWEVKYIQKAKDTCIIDGNITDGKLYFSPYKNMTRAEVAKVVYNMLNIK